MKEYNYIINPKDNSKVPLKSKLGLSIIQKYLKLIQKTILSNNEYSKKKAIINPVQFGGFEIDDYNVSVHSHLEIPSLQFISYNEMILNKHVQGDIIITGYEHLLDIYNGPITSLTTPTFAGVKIERLSTGIKIYFYGRYIINDDEHQLMFIGDEKISDADLISHSYERMNDRYEKYVKIKKESSIYKCISFNDWEKLYKKGVRDNWDGNWELFELGTERGYVTNYLETYDNNQKIFDIRELLMNKWWDNFLRLQEYKKGSLVNISCKMYRSQPRFWYFENPNKSLELGESEALSYELNPSAKYKIHISCNANYSSYCFVKLLEYIFESNEKRDDESVLVNWKGIHSFKIGDSTMSHHYNKSTFNRDRWQIYDDIMKSEPGVQTARGNIVIYPVECSKAQFSEILRSFSSWWITNVESQTDSSLYRDDHYLTFNERITGTIFLTYGGSSGQRIDCVIDNSCDDYIQRKSITDIIQSYCKHKTKKKSEEDKIEEIDEESSEIYESVEDEDDDVVSVEIEDESVELSKIEYCLNNNFGLTELDNYCIPKYLADENNWSSRYADVWLPENLSDNELLSTKCGINKSGELYEDGDIFDTTDDESITSEPKHSPNLTIPIPPPNLSRMFSSRQKILSNKSRPDYSKL